MIDKSQLNIYYQESHKIGARSEMMTDMIRNGDVTRQDLYRLIERRPMVYGMFQRLADNAELWEDEAPGKYRVSTG